MKWNCFDLGLAKYFQDEENVKISFLLLSKEALTSWKVFAKSLSVFLFINLYLKNLATD